jgi:energy-coupling factor transport system ATP-binding protein
MITETPDQADSPIRLDRLSFFYPSSDRPVLRDLTLEVARGQFVAIEGATGSGKTTLCLTLNGIIPHATPGRFKGNVYIAGTNTKETSVPELARFVGLVYQDPESQLFGLTVEEDVAFGLENLALPRQEMRERVDWALEAVGLSDLRLRSPTNLSGGQKQRLAIASVLAMRPQIMVLDEPTAELDPIGKNSILAVVRRLCEEFQLTVILVEHECEFIAEYADSVLLIEDGAIVRRDAPDSFYSWLAHSGNERIRIPQVTELGLPLGQTSSKLPVRTEQAYDWLSSSLDRRPSPNPTAVTQLATAEPLVRVEDVSFAYIDGTQALAGVSLQVGRGEYVALVGQNGSGKTTLARHLNGLLRPSRGRVLIGGQDIKGRSVAQLSSQVGYLFQNPDHQLFADSVEAELLFGPLNHGVPRDDCIERAERALRLCGIEHLRGEHPLFTSRGERQLIAIASIVTMAPPIMIFDEPTTGLDERYYRLVVALLSALHHDGSTLIVISHDMRLVAEEAQRMVVLRQGNIVIDAPTSAAFTQVEILNQTQIEPPQITRLSQRLPAYGIEPALSVEALQRQVAPRLRSIRANASTDFPPTTKAQYSGHARR